jgi:hypothetical protein
MIRYYFDENPNILTKYKTVWHGHFFYHIGKNTNYLTNDQWSILNDILQEICDVNFYIHCIENNIYLSLCQDFMYYYYDFEKHIRTMIREIEKHFTIDIEYGEFYGTELKPMGDQYKYIIKVDSNQSDKSNEITESEELESAFESLDLNNTTIYSKKIKVTKKILNWKTYDDKKIKIKIKKEK